MTTTNPPTPPAANPPASKPDKPKWPINQPQTAFPMKAGLVQNEPASVKRWHEIGVYQRLRERAASGQEKRFVFHDGPPYANGGLHLGHLMNRCLKDFVVRSRSMMGFDCPFVPGWDCHGLPIEHKVLTELVEKGKWEKIKALAADQRNMIVRRESQAYAEKSQKLQRTQMERFLTIADYENPYLTMQKEFEGATLDVLATLVSQGLVYRALKPVHWSIANETALAEAELEYQDREDPSVFVDFEAESADAVYDAFGLPKEEANAEGAEGEDSTQHTAHSTQSDEEAGGAPRPGVRPNQTPCFMIWTTTPWTLPANLAIAVNPKYEYSLVWVDGNVTVIASALVEKVTAKGKAEQVVEIARTTGDRLVRLRYRHPFVDAKKGESFGAMEGVRNFPNHGYWRTTFKIVPAEYVTLEDGTGLVHTAPGHGVEDFQTGLRETLPIYCPVRADGTYDATAPEWLRSTPEKKIDVWAANGLIVTRLRESGHMFHDFVFTHSYPHDWRSKTPTIFRCTEQWFVYVDRPFAQGVIAPAGVGATLRTRSLLAIGALDAPAIEADLRHINPTQQPAVWADICKPLGAQVSALDTDDGVQAMRRHAHTAMQGGTQPGSVAAFVPEWGRNRMRGMLESRPDWCISRQRAWGLPIPAFFWRDDAGVDHAFLTATSVRAIATLIREKGSDIWFTVGPEELLSRYDVNTDADAPAWLKSDASRLKSVRKGGDIVDVWFESGSTWNAVMRQRAPDSAKGLPDRGGGFPMDLYLEGSDQHRGWFQSSLLPSLAVTGKPPFKTLLTHGFIVDKDGKKLSKSRADAKRYEVDSLCGEFGMDVMRWWVASLPFENDVKADLEFFATSGESYRKVRNTLRFMLSNLYDYDVAADGPNGTSAPPTPAPATTSLDAWALGAFADLARRVEAAYDAYDFRGVQSAIYDFCNDTLSATYFVATKDRLYCDAPGSTRRRGCQRVLRTIGDGLCRLLAPMLPHTADEAWRALHKVPDADRTRSVHLERFLPASAIGGATTDPAWAKVMEARAAAQMAIERAKRELGVDNPLDTAVNLPDPDDTLAKFDLTDLADLLGVSRVTLDKSATTATVRDLRTEPRCERSWRRDGTVKPRGPQGAMLSDRDAAAVGLG